MNGPLSRYNVTVSVGGNGGYLPDPAAFAAAADQGGMGRSASIISAHLADKIISVVTVTAPHRYAAVAPRFFRVPEGRRKAMLVTDIGYALAGLTAVGIISAACTARRPWCCWPPPRSCSPD
jgi:hypothetical protein